MQTTVQAEQRQVDILCETQRKRYPTVTTHCRFRRVHLDDWARSGLRSGSLLPQIDPQTAPGLLSVARHPQRSEQGIMLGDGVTVNGQADVGDCETVARMQGETQAERCTPRVGRRHHHAPGGRKHFAGKKRLAPLTAKGIERQNDIVRRFVFENIPQHDGFIRGVGTA
ncbi:MAG: hypothetical protein GF331_15940 [Chitinivibrionales bacterium]|nr:hypothetical protein [Chitinivibrionales bacterium]